ncbi:MAG: gluconeogenesis factor YvcK family protein, partial [Phototrophicaceae bacterium]
MKQPNLGISKWVLLFVISTILFVSGAMGVGFSLESLYNGITLLKNIPYINWIFVLMGGGGLCYSVYRVYQVLVVPLRAKNIDVGDTLVRHQQSSGIKVVAIGGGTGLPSSLRAMKRKTTNITAIVTVADDGGSSGKLREELGVLPPGDLRNNIVALANDDSTLAKLFQYRFTTGSLSGHSFGNLFISVLSTVTEGGLEGALIETGRVLNIRGRVLPSTLEDVNLRAEIQLPGKNRTIQFLGESAIGDAGGRIHRLELVPSTAKAYHESVEAILEAELIVIGPGSLYTSILPNLLVSGIANALRATTAFIVYVCNIATQPGETDGYSVAEHVMAIEEHVGRGVFSAVLANNTTPPPPDNVITEYVNPIPANHQILQRYEVFY